jgi:TIR domain
VAFDVFVSYASKDKTVADALCARLESAGIRCWIAPRDIVPGTSYGQSIIEAIQVAKVMVLVFSSNANASSHIPKEVERAMSNGVVILPFRIEDVAPGRSLDYFIGSVHWLDAMTPPLEKHLDDLATTVHKLLPALPSDQGTSTTQPSGTPQQNAWGNAAAAAPVTAVRRSPAAGSPGSSSAKTIWIGVVAVVVLAAVVTGGLLLRGGKNSQGGTGGQVPVATNPSSDKVVPGDVNPPVDIVTKKDSHPALTNKPGSQIAPPTSLPMAKSAFDPIVGCYQWFNNVPVLIHADGTIVAGPFTGHWRSVNARHAYTFSWPEAIDTITISPDQQSLSGSNNYGYPTSGTRIAGGTGLIGTWRWPNAVPVAVSPGGTFSAATFRGRWQAVDPSRGIYTLTWPGPVDSVTLSADGSRVSGANQYGVAISGTRTQPCGGT